MLYGYEGVTLLNVRGKRGAPYKHEDGCNEGLLQECGMRYPKEKITIFLKRKKKVLLLMLL